MLLEFCISAAQAAVAMQGVAKIVQKVGPSIVDIYTLQMTNAFTGDPFFDALFGGNASITPSSGSGVIISENGIVVTCAHVVQRANQIKIRLSNLKEFTANVLHIDQEHDLAFLKIQTNEKLPYIQFGDSDELHAGDFTVAIGNTFGLGQSVTGGLISAPLRSFGKMIAVQTDAAINPGNSGGGLINIKGELIGLPNAILSRSGASHGVGFAIPSNLVKAIKAELSGRKPGSFGLTVSSIPEHMRAQNHRGVVVQSIDTMHPSPLRVGDVITAIGKKAIHTPEEFDYRERLTSVGQTVPVRVYRDGKYQSLRVKMAQNNEIQAQNILPPVVPSDQKMLISGKHLLNGAEVAQTAAGVIFVMPPPELSLILKSNDTIQDINGTPVPHINALSQKLLDPLLEKSCLLRLKNGATFEIKKFSKKTLLGGSVVAKDITKNGMIFLVAPKRFQHIQKGDILLRINDQNIQSLQDMEALQDHTTHLTIELKRGNAIITSSVSNHSSNRQAQVFDAFSQLFRQ